MIETSGTDWSITDTSYGATAPRDEEKTIDISNVFILGVVTQWIGYFLESRVYRCEINYVNFYWQVVGIIQDAGLQPGRRGAGGLFGGEPVPC